MVLDEGWAVKFLHTYVVGPVGHQAVKMGSSRKTIRAAKAHPKIAKGVTDKKFVNLKKVPVKVIITNHLSVSSLA
jgi:hypothetical protein